MGNRFGKGTSESEGKEPAVDLTKNEKWVARIEEHFDLLDVNKNGYLTIDEILKWSDNLRELCQVTPEEVKNFHEHLKEFYGAAGLVADKQMTKEEFVESLNRLADAEVKRKKSGAATLHEKLSNAFFDVVDINNDGTVSLDELTKMMKACNMGEENAEKWFNMADKNENGKVERKELIRAEFDYFFTPPKDESSAAAEEKESKE